MGIIDLEYGFMLGRSIGVKAKKQNDAIIDADFEEVTEDNVASQLPASEGE